MAINVFVIDDSSFMRKVISDLVETDSNLEVIQTARNGKDALQKLAKITKQVDVITLDVEMPELDGLQTLKFLKEEYAEIPVIMLSSTTKAGAENTLIALERGAFDFIAKPSGPISLDIHQVQDELITKIKLAYENKIHDEKPIVERSLPQTPIKKSRKNVRKDLSHIIMIGTSTGGPKALYKLLTSLPRLDRAAILIVQHMPPSFTHSLADRLNKQTVHRVHEASDGDQIKGGHIYIAPGDYHMEIEQEDMDYKISLNQSSLRGGHRPSVDVMLESAKHVHDSQLVAVILTGMGKDGTEGLKALRQTNDVYSLAEDESTCVVYGMPRSVAESGLADEVIPLHNIHIMITRYVNHSL